MAIRLTQLPCSEAAVERALSQLKVIFGDRKHHMLSDLLGALLFTRTNAKATELRTLASFGTALEDLARQTRFSDLVDHGEPLRWIQENPPERMGAGTPGGGE
jgi:hypothetical protein